MQEGSWAPAVLPWRLDSVSTSCCALCTRGLSPRPRSLLAATGGSRPRSFPRTASEYVRASVKRRVMGRDPYAGGDPLHRTALGLGGGCVLVAAGVAVLVLGLFDVLLRYGIALAAIAAVVILVGIELVRVRSRPDRGQLLWTALLDAILVVAVVLAIAPIAAL